MHKHPIAIRSALGLLLTGALLASCSMAGISQSAATSTALAQRNALQATRLAEHLQDTDLAELAGQTATHQAKRQQTAQAELNQQATMDARAATDQAYEAQNTAEALELQRLIETARQWPATVADSFDSPAYDWPQGSETFSSGQISWSTQAGQYTWLAEASQGYTYWTVPTTQAVSDFYLAVEVQHTGGSAESEAGLVFHTKQQDYWCFLISGDGDLFIGLRVNGEWQLSWPLGSSRIHTDQPNHLAIIGQNNRHYFLINGYNFITIGNSTLPSGPAGLIISLWNAGDQATWAFDNFELRTPGTPSP